MQEEPHQIIFELLENAWQWHKNPLGKSNYKVAIAIHPLFRHTKNGLRSVTRNAMRDPLAPDPKE